MNGVAWSRLAAGLQLIGFGVFLLLTTQGLLPWSFWLEAASFWPVLLVGAGLRLVFQPSRLPWAVLMSPLVVIGTLVLVARGGLPPRPAEDWVARSVDRPESAERVTLVAHLAGGRLDVQSASVTPGMLVEGRSASRGGRGRLDREGSGADVRLHLDEGHQEWIVLGPRRKQAWDLRLDETLPASLEIEGVFLAGRLDLARGRLGEAGVEGVLNDFELRLPRPETDASLHVEGVFNRLRLIVPPGTPVRVHAEGPFNSIDRGRTGEDGPGYDVRVEGVMNRLEVETEG